MEREHSIAASFLTVCSLFLLAGCTTTQSGSSAAKVVYIKSAPVESTVSLDGVTVGKTLHSKSMPATTQTSTQAKISHPALPQSVRPPAVPEDNAGYKEWMDYTDEVRKTAVAFKDTDSDRYARIIEKADALEESLVLRHMRELQIKLDRASMSGDDTEVARALLEFDEIRIRHQDLLDKIRYSKDLAHSQGIPVNTANLDRLLPEAVFPMLQARGYDAVEMIRRSRPDWWKGKGFADDDEEADMLSGLFTGVHKPQDNATVAAMHSVMRLAQDNRATAADVQRAKFAAKQDLCAVNDFFPAYNAPAELDATGGRADTAPIGQYTEAERARIVMDLSDLRNINPGVRSGTIYDTYRHLCGLFSKGMEDDTIRRFEAMRLTKVAAMALLSNPDVKVHQALPTINNMLETVTPYIRPEAEKSAVVDNLIRAAVSYDAVRMRAEQDYPGEAYAGAREQYLEKAKLYLLSLQENGALVDPSDPNVLAARDFITKSNIDR